MDIVFLSSSTFSLSEVLIHHLADVPLWHIEWNGWDLSITKRVVMMWIASLCLIFTFVPMARKLARDPFKRPSRFMAFMETLINFIRNDVCTSLLGSHGKSYEPFLLTLFFFILLCNLLGLLPPVGEVVNWISSVMSTSSGQEHVVHGATSIPLMVKLWPGITATGDISVTLGLSGVVFVIIIVSGFIYQGLAYVKNIVPSGVPVILSPLLWLIELAGLCIKPIALSIRLLANMTAGHIIILIIMGFIFQFRNYSVATFSVLAATAIYFLEIFVAFLQAYIFAFLTSLFISEAHHRH